MTYRREDWVSMVARLDEADRHLTDYRSLEPRPTTHPTLDQAVWLVWTLGEYLVNVCLEQHGQTAPQDHSQVARARGLFAEQKLKKDYGDLLERLERFRLKASHSGYVKERSTHYSSADVTRAMGEMRELVAEVEAVLRERGKL